MSLGIAFERKIVFFLSLKLKLRQDKQLGPLTSAHPLILTRMWLRSGPDPTHPRVTSYTLATSCQHSLALPPCCTGPLSYRLSLTGGEVGGPQDLDLLDEFDRHLVGEGRQHRFRIKRLGLRTPGLCEGLLLQGSIHLRERRQGHQRSEVMSLRWAQKHGGKNYIDNVYYLYSDMCVTIYLVGFFSEC